MIDEWLLLPEERQSSVVVVEVRVVSCCCCCCLDLENFFFVVVVVVVVDDVLIIFWCLISYFFFFFLSCDNLLLSCAGGTMLLRVMEVDVRHGEMKVIHSVEAPVGSKSAAAPTLCTSSSFAGRGRRMGREEEEENIESDLESSSSTRAWCLGVSGIFCLEEKERRERKERKRSGREIKKKTSAHKKEEKEENAEEEEEEEEENQENTEPLRSFEDVVLLLSSKIDARSLPTVVQSCFHATTSSSHEMKQLYTHGIDKITCSKTWSKVSCGETRRVLEVGVS